MIDLTRVKGQNPLVLNLHSGFIYQSTNEYGEIKLLIHQSGIGVRSGSPGVVQQGLVKDPVCTGSSGAVSGSVAE